MLTLHSYTNLLMGIATSHVWFDWSFSRDDRSTSSTSSIPGSLALVQPIYLFQIDFTKPIPSKKMKI